MNFLREGFRKLSSDRQTYRNDKNYTARLFAGARYFTIIYNKLKL